MGGSASDEVDGPRTLEMKVIDYIGSKGCSDGMHGPGSLTESQGSAKDDLGARARRWSLVALVSLWQSSWDRINNLLNSKG